MEEDKAAAYYDELTRKGGGAARFKQGLGFSASSSDDPPTRGSALALPSSTSSFLSNFVRASSPSKTKVLEKQAQIQSIQNKLKRKEPTISIDEDISSDKSRVRVRDRDRDRDRRSPRRRSRSRSRERDRDRHSRRNRSRSRSRERKRRSRSRSRERKRGRDSDVERRKRRRSRSRSSSDGDRRHRRERGRSRSLSPRVRRSEKSRDGERKERKVLRKVADGPVDYAKLIDGYDSMTPAERVKAKMKIQLSQTAEKDAKIGAGSGWERFEFDKDAPVDDEQIEATDDDAALVKHINQTFRFASLESKREDEIRAAHDEAMFGAPAAPAESDTSDSEGTSENENKETHVDDDDPASCLLNEKVLAKQQGSWRDRARRNVR